MTRWMKVLAVALAAVVGVVPTFAQVSLVQAASVKQSTPVLPNGEELDDVALAEVDGDEALLAACVYGAIKLTAGIVKLWKAAKAAAVTAAAMSTAALQNGCQRVVEVGRSLTLKSASFVVQHKLATDITVGMTVGGLHGGLRSDAPTVGGKLAHAAEGAAIGLGAGLTAFGVQSLAEWWLRKRP